MRDQTVQKRKLTGIQPNLEVLSFHFSNSLGIYIEFGLGYIPAKKVKSILA